MEKLEELRESLGGFVINGGKKEYEIFGSNDLTFLNDSSLSEFYIQDGNQYKKQYRTVMAREQAKEREREQEIKLKRKHENSVEEISSRESSLFREREGGYQYFNLEPLPFIQGLKTEPIKKDNNFSNTNRLKMVSDFLTQRHQEKNPTQEKTNRGHLTALPKLNSGFIK